MKSKRQLYSVLAVCGVFAMSAGAYAAKELVGSGDINVAKPADPTAQPQMASNPVEGKAIVIAAAEKAGDANAATGADTASKDYYRAQWDPIHFKPAIDSATDEQCLACHAEVLESPVLEKSEAGITAADSLAWYQTLDTYSGEQMNFHQRHMTSDFAKEVMNLSCTFCHQGNDPREESAHVTVADADLTANNGQVPFTLRKMVNPSETCLRCHGNFPWENMEGLSGPWHEIRGDFEFEPGENGCLTCHADLFRTVRHQVTYLNAEAIEEAAQSGSDVCYGCHGGRQWYRINYPYPRHAWPDMPEETPEWATDRPTESDPRYQIKQ